MKSDLQISQSKKLRDIISIAKKINLKSTDLTTFGKHIAKINPIPNRKKNAKLILVTAMSPTPAGEGKTTTTVGLTDALRKIGKKINCMPQGAFPRPSFWNERWCDWGWIFSGLAHGRN